MAVYNAAVTLKAADVHMLADLRSAGVQGVPRRQPRPRHRSPSPARSARPGSTGPTSATATAPPARATWGRTTRRSPKKAGSSPRTTSRPYLDAGHASESPSSQHTPGPMQAPSEHRRPHRRARPRVHVLQRDRVHAARHVRDARPHLPPLPRRLPHGSEPRDRLQPGPRPRTASPSPPRHPEPGRPAKAAKRAKVKARKAAKVKAAKAWQPSGGRLSGRYSRAQCPSTPPG